MKKIISLLLVTALVISSMIIFASCESNDDDDGFETIELTVDNYDKYLDITAKLYGTNGRWNSLASDYYYSRVTASVDVAPRLSSTILVICSMDVRILGEYYSGGGSDKRTFDETIYVRLDSDGYGNETKDEYVPLSNANRIKGIGYEVVSITGEVSISKN